MKKLIIAATVMILTTGCGFDTRTTDLKPTETIIEETTLHEDTTEENVIIEEKITEKYYVTTWDDNPNITYWD